MSAAPSPLRSTVLAAICGSNSLFGYTVPGWAATLSAVQPLNGEVPETCWSGPTEAGPAQPLAGTSRITPATTASAGITRLIRISPPRSGRPPHDPATDAVVHPRLRLPTSQPENVLISAKPPSGATPVVRS